MWVGRSRRYMPRIVRAEERRTGWRMRETEGGRERARK